MRPDRLPLGTLCTYVEFFPGEPTVCIVVGTWRYTNAQGAPGSVETMSRHWRTDPRTDEVGDGYLLLPSGGTGFIYACWGDLANGDLAAV